MENKYFDSGYEDIKELLMDIYTNADHTFYYYENLESCADWDEFMCMLYDDFNFDDYIAYLTAKYSDKDEVVSDLKLINLELNAIDISATSQLLKNEHWLKAQIVSKHLIEVLCF